jgi:acetyltransferase-like isoleucine patch superfamily enzyme
MSIASSAKIYPLAKLIHDGSNFTVGDRSQIDDFVFINAGRGCRIGRFVHIASFVSVIGGGEFTIDDFAGLSTGCRVITGTDDYTGPFLTNPTVPREFTNYQISRVTIEKHAIVGTNSVIFPGVTIGEGAAVGACAVVHRSLPPWGIYVGEPLRKIGERDRAAILEKTRRMLEQLAGRAVG